MIEARSEIRQAVGIHRDNASASGLLIEMRDGCKLVAAAAAAVQQHNQRRWGLGVKPLRTEESVGSASPPMAILPCSIEAGLVVAVAGADVADDPQP